MTCPRGRRAGLMVIAVASLASIATSEPERPGWSRSERADLQACPPDEDGWRTYVVSSTLEVVADPDTWSPIWSLHLGVLVRGSTDAGEPRLTAELRDAASDQTLAASTRRGEEGSVAVRLNHPLLEWGACDIPAVGEGRCDHEFLLLVQGDPELEITGFAEYTASGDKDAHGDPDPDVSVALQLGCAEVE
jgi:hypothetical protein